MDQEDRKDNQTKTPTVIMYTQPQPQVQTPSKSKLQDFIDLQSVFSSNSVLNITEDGGIKKIMGTKYSKDRQEINEKKLKEEEGSKNLSLILFKVPNERSKIYFRQEIWSMEGVLLNKDVKANIQAIKVWQDQNKSSVGLHFAISSLKYGETGVFRVVPVYQQSLMEVQLKTDVAAKRIIFMTEAQHQNFKAAEDQIYIVTFTDYKNEKKQTSQYTYEERLDKAEFYKSQGSLCFKEGKYDEAEKHYSKIPTFTNSIPKTLRENWSEQQREVMKQICAKAYINMAVCFLKKGQWLSVKEQSAKALEFDENNLKASTILGRSNYELKNYIDAKEVFSRLLERELLAEEKAEIVHYMNLMNKKVDNALVKREKKIAQHIISNLSSVDPDEELRKRKAKYEEVQKLMYQNEMIEKSQKGAVSDQKDFMSLLQQSFI